MTSDEILKNKTIHQKAKVAFISDALLEYRQGVNELIDLAASANDLYKATCIESLEFASRLNARLANDKCMTFVTQSLMENDPRIKWESAKVIGNIAPLFPDKLNKAIGNLLINTENKGTVVRRAAAFALGEILKLKIKHNKDLLPCLEVLSNSEGNNAIKKKYIAAIKKSKNLMCIPVRYRNQACISAIQATF